MAQKAHTVRPPVKTNMLLSRKILGLVIFYIFISALALLYISPLLWMAATAFKLDHEATKYPLSWIPEEWRLDAFQRILASNQTPVFRWFANSMISASAQMLLVLVTASSAAYPLARMDFRGKKIVFGLIVSTLFIPHIIFLIPNYLIVDYLGWLDTLWAVIVPGAAGAFGVFFMRQFFLSLPKELEEAAVLDGANHFQIFMRIIVPLSTSALATLAVLSFLTNWNDFLWPVYVLFTPENFTLQPGLTILQDSNTINYPVIMAGALFASLPVIALFIIAQRYVIEGVARSGLKG